MHTKVLHNQEKLLVIGVYDNTDTNDTKMHCAVNTGSSVVGKSSSVRPEWLVSSEEVDFQTYP